MNYLSVTGAPATDFVFVGIQSWDLPIGGNAKDMARELARTRRVLYVNPPVDRVTRLRRPDTPATDGIFHRLGRLVQISDTLWVLYPAVTLESINWLPDSFVFDFMNRLNNQRLARSIRWATDQLAFGSYTLFNDSDMVRSFYLKELLRPAHYVYYTRDNLQAVLYWQRHGARLEPTLMKKADLVVSNSPFLARVARQHNPHAVCIGQGCDLSLFDPDRTYSPPADIAALAHPRVGYVGALNGHRLSIDWLEQIARQRPHWNLVLVGPEDEFFQQSSLHQLPNVYFLGSKAPADLPAYLQQLDVAINPQRLNNLTIGNYPRKVDEYLAMGKPVVALRTETMSLFADCVTLADTLPDFIDGIDRALTRPIPAAAGMAMARQHGWQQTIDALLTTLSQVSGSPNHAVS